MKDKEHKLEPETNLALTGKLSSRRATWLRGVCWCYQHLALVMLCLLKVTAICRSRWEARTDSEPRANLISALSGKLAESNTMKHYCWWSQILAYSLLLMHALVVTVARTRCYCYMLSLSLSCAEPDGKQGKEEKPEPEANFALSGKLAAESNTVKGVVLVHQEPPEARKPSQMWRLYGFKNGEPSLFLLLLFPLLLLLLLSSSSSSSCSSSLLLLLSFFVFFFISSSMLPALTCMAGGLRQNQMQHNRVW